MAMRATTKHYLIGLLAGLGFGVFLALALAEDGDLAPGITPRSIAWKVLKMGGLTLAVAAGVWHSRAYSRLGRAAEAEPAAAVDPPKAAGH